MQQNGVDFSQANLKITELEPTPCSSGSSLSMNYPGLGKRPRILGPVEVLESLDLECQVDNIDHIDHQLEHQQKASAQ